MSTPVSKSWSYSTIPGTRTRYDPVQQKVITVWNSNAPNGEDGSLTGFGNPYPYVDGSSFQLRKEAYSPGLCNGTYHRFSTWDDIYVDYQWVPHLGVTANTGGTFDTIESVLARSNPSRPIVDVPVFIVELREVPELVRVTGRSLLKYGASVNLLSQFGWQPFIRDLIGILSFQKAVDRRVKHLHHMYKRGGLRFTAPLGTTIQNDSWSGWTSYQGRLLRSRRSGVTRRWGQVSWVPSVDLRNHIPPVDEIRARAFKAVFGLQITTSTVWEALPWTWLSDWFTTTGDYLQSQRNTVGFVPGKCWQMTDSRSWRDYQTSGGYAGVSYTDPVKTRTDKLRTVVSPSPFNAQLPILTLRQWGILTSLAILRAKS